MVYESKVIQFIDILCYDKAYDSISPVMEVSELKKKTCYGSIIDGALNKENKI